jgi:diaminopimelate epimerase
MKFTKYHALGNDYIVIDPKDVNHEITEQEVKILCDRHYGIGSDGILFGPLKSQNSDFGLRIFNPDGGEAEKSGNGLRIFSRYLWDRGLVKNASFSIETKGGEVFSQVHNQGQSVSVDMGMVRFTHEADARPNIQPENIQISGKNFTFYRANVGNPHCVIIVSELSKLLATEYGKIIEQDSLFENRTNVQFVKILDRHNIQIEIWERGAGYTLASGSSSTASAAVAHSLNLCDPSITLHMPGGIIEIELNDKFEAKMTGAVCKIAEGEVVQEAFA